MKKAKKLIVGNWKMNPATVAEAKKIAAEVKKGMLGVRKTQAVMCPPFVYLSPLSGTATSTVLLGAQDAFYETAGPYTGEVSYCQLHQFKVSHVIVGHSERRARGETDEIVNKKVRAVVGEGMTAIVCVGERVRDQHGDYFSSIREQILFALKDISKKLLDHVVIAYEPVWAIGASAAMTPQDLHEMSIFIRKTLREPFGSLADGIAILYGGSVTAENATPIVRDGHVQGLLIGRESLKPKEFIKIIKTVDAI
jgi:triosephosphate isomerase (TIM)